MSSGPDLRDPRRAARIPAHCPVLVRHRFFQRWHADSEDLGPTGCRLITPHLLEEGTQVRLFIRLPRLGRTVQGTATVVWAREAERSRLGLRFTPGKWERRWFDALLAADPRLAAAAQHRPAVLPWRAELYLGTPRRKVSDYSRDELTVLHRMRSRITVLELVASLGKASDRLVGALFSLVAHRQLVLDPAAAQRPEAWQSLFSQFDALDAADWITPERGLPLGPDGGQNDEVHRLLTAGREHLAAGRIALAAELFRQARALAPDDKDARAEVRNMGRYG